jgi:hypothetical protein
MYEDRRMTYSRDGLQKKDGIAIRVAEDDAPSPRNNKRSPSSSPPIQTNSRFHPNTSTLNDAESIIRKHSQDEAETETVAESSINSSRSSYASTSLNTPQTTPLPISPANSQTNSPTTSSTESNSSQLYILPALIAPPLSPGPLITMPSDPIAIIAGADETNQLSLNTENSLVDMVVKGNTFSASIPQEPTLFVQGLVAHIWEENIEILSLARYNRHVGIYYPHGINKTVMATGRAVRNRDEFFKPENVSFLTQYGPNANFKVSSLQELNPKVEEPTDFDFSDALIFLPICYTARHVLAGDEFFDVLKYFVFEKKCSIMIYLGRDAGLEENKVKRAEWLQGHQAYIQQINELNPAFWKKNQNIRITITHRHELVKTPQYLYAEFYFARYLANKKPVLSAIKGDVVERLTQKKFLLSKAVNIHQSSPLAPSTPQLLSTSPISLFPRPHSHPGSSNKGSLMDQKFVAQQIIKGVLNSDTEDEFLTQVTIARELIHQEQDSKHNPFASIFQSSPLRGSVAPVESSSDEEDEEEEKQSVGFIQDRSSRVRPKQ